jgi:hypothetical protein
MITAKAYAGSVARHLRIQLQDEELPLAIEHGFGGKKNVGPENSIYLRFMEQARRATGTAKIDNHHRLVNEVQSAKLQAFGNGNTIESAIDAETGRELGANANFGKTKMLAAIQGDGADGGTGINAEPAWFVVDENVDEQVVLL